MRAVILAAGMARCLSRTDPPPKILLPFGGETLLARHPRILDHFDMGRIDLCVGFPLERIAGELARLGNFPEILKRPGGKFSRGWRCFRNELF